MTDHPVAYESNDHTHPVGTINCKRAVIFSPISIDEFVKKHVRGNPGENAADLRASLRDAAKRKRDGEKYWCGQPIWAIGSAITGMDRCFACIIGESDGSDDYEIDGVCF